MDVAKHYLNFATVHFKKLIINESTPLLKTFTAFPDALDILLLMLGKMNQAIFSELASFIECFDSFFLSTRDSSYQGGKIDSGLDSIRSIFWTKLPFDVF